jgi:predicted PurR-regulated permease PerM
MESMRLPELLVVLAIAASLVVIVWPAARICQRAGFPTWLGVLSVVPILNVLLLWYVAVAPWPVARDAASGT